MKNHLLFVTVTVTVIAAAVASVVRPRVPHASSSRAATPSGISGWPRARSQRSKRPRVTRAPQPRRTKRSAVSTRSRAGSRRACFPAGTTSRRARAKRDRAQGRGGRRSARSSAQEALRTAEGFAAADKVDPAPPRPEIQALDAKLQAVQPSPTYAADVAAAVEARARAQADPAPYFTGAQMLIDRGDYDRAIALAERGAVVSDRFIDENLSAYQMSGKSEGSKARGRATSADLVGWAQFTRSITPRQQRSSARPSGCRKGRISPTSSISASWPGRRTPRREHAIATSTRCRLRAVRRRCARKPRMRWWPFTPAARALADSTAGSTPS